MKGLYRGHMASLWGAVLCVEKLIDRLKESWLRAKNSSAGGHCQRCGNPRKGRPNQAEQDLGLSKGLA